jgi:hypothetical protein
MVYKSFIESKVASMIYYAHKAGKAVRVDEIIVKCLHIDALSKETYDQIEKSINELLFKGFIYEEDVEIEDCICGKAIYINCENSSARNYFDFTHPDNTFYINPEYEYPNCKVYAIVKDMIYCNRCGAHLEESTENYWKRCNTVGCDFGCYHRYFTDQEVTYLIRYELYNAYKNHVVIYRDVLIKTLFKKRITKDQSDKCIDGMLHKHIIVENCEQQASRISLTNSYVDSCKFKKKQEIERNNAWWDDYHSCVDDEEDTVR